MKYPTLPEARRILEDYPIFEGVYKHSKEVSEHCVIIGNQIKSAGKVKDLDICLLEVGGLLHDIGRHKYFNVKDHTHDRDFHEYETGKLLRELGYVEFGNMLQCHPLGGLTAEEAVVLGYPKIDMIPKTLEIKTICIADKIRPHSNILNLEQKINDYKTNERLHQRYFNKLSGLLETTIDRVSNIWYELVSLGMKNPPIK